MSLIHLKPAIVRGKYFTRDMVGWSGGSIYLKGVSVEYGVAWGDLRTPGGVVLGGNWGVAVDTALWPLSLARQINSLHTWRASSAFPAK